jgi:hypothetical protein
MRNRYEIGITVRRLSANEQDKLDGVLALPPGEYLALARIGNTVEWAIDEGATLAAAQAAAKAIGERVKHGDLVVEEDDDVEPER